MDFTTVSNLPIFWALAGVTIVISALQAYFYIREANIATRECNINPEIPKQAFRIGLISAIGPALGVFIVMVGLMAAIGGPMAWLRLSIIGAAPTELAAATCGAQACGMDNLADPRFNELWMLAVAWFGMALNGAGWLVFTGLFTPGLEKLRDKLSGGDTSWLAAMSAACSIGIFAYLNANNIITKTRGINIGGTWAALGGAVSMMIIGRVFVPKCPKLAEYSLGIAMIIGIALALMFA